MTYDTSKMNLIAQGAEGRVYETTFLGRPTIVKERFPKKYRHPTLDEKLTLRRCRAEVSCILRARKLGILVPTIYLSDPARGCILMERVQGTSLKTLIMENALSKDVLDRALASLGEVRIYLES